MLAVCRAHYAELEERHQDLQRQYDTLQQEHQRIRSGYSDALQGLSGIGGDNVTPIGRSCLPSPTLSTAAYPAPEKQSCNNGHGDYPGHRDT